MTQRARGIRWKPWDGETIHNAVCFNNPENQVKLPSSSSSVVSGDHHDQNVNPTTLPSSSEDEMSKWCRVFREDQQRDPQVIWMWDRVNGQKQRTAFDVHELWEYLCSCELGECIRWPWGKGLEGLKVTKHMVRRIGDLAGLRNAEVRTELRRKQEIAKQKRQQQIEDDERLSRQVAENEMLNQVLRYWMVALEPSPWMPWLGSGGEGQEEEFEPEGENVSDPLSWFPAADRTIELTSMIHFPPLGMAGISIPIDESDTEEEEGEEDQLIFPELDDQLDDQFLHDLSVQEGETDPVAHLPEQESHSHSPLPEDHNSSPEDTHL